MNASATLRKAMAEKLAADTATLAQAADANLVALVKVGFASNENTVVGDLTDADFDGYAAIEAELNAQQCGIDPLTGDSLITIIPPVGGWHWECSGLNNAPQTIYGVKLTNNDGTVLYGTYILADPITINAVGQTINLPALTFRLPAGTLV